jgi:hypothetical protein
MNEVGNKIIVFLDVTPFSLAGTYISKTPALSVMYIMLQVARFFEMSSRTLRFYSRRQSFP